MTYHGGRHEHGQNFLAHQSTITRITRLVADTEGPIVEVGPGYGSLTKKFQKLDRPLTAVEIDGRLVDHLTAVLAAEVEVVHADFLTWKLPRRPHVVAGNLPFHLTTAILRKILHTHSWTHAVLLVQWEVARRRAGIGGASMMTAQWWPWVSFDVDARVPQSAFRPAPTVDGGLLLMEKRSAPLVDPAYRKEYRQFVHDVFTGRGRGVADIVARRSRHSAMSARNVVTDAGVRARALPKDLTPVQWADLFHGIIS
ncbi:23S ribosomal RNA methyltransferase Erm [Gordonia zhaorongruii]|uniref:23S ribosomal RNA methyltransferase Erm n=1 Tax=Gordonia zhaorongruii TaxID=2597659 RepID=UPI00117D8C32|nr:23S ribosomal RNA methyltransferase Erm [Gordonia zhaorongruii]